VSYVHVLVESEGRLLFTWYPVLPHPIEPRHGHETYALHTPGRYCQKQQFHV